MVGKSVVTLDGLSTNQILDLLHKAEYIDSHRKEIAHTCDGRVLATLFYEPSTRTRLSFETAMLRLGGKVIGFAGVDYRHGCGAGGHQRGTLLRVTDGDHVHVVGHGLQRVGDGFALGHGGQLRAGESDDLAAET